MTTLHVSPSVMASEVLAFLELVHRAAVRAFGLARAGDVQVDARMAVPQLHAGSRAGAEHAAVGVEVAGEQFDHEVFVGRIAGHISSPLRCASQALRGELALRPW